jgi:hypothetical protein
LSCVPTLQRIMVSCEHKSGEYESEDGRLRRGGSGWSPLPPTRPRP